MTESEIREIVRSEIAEDPEDIIGLLCRELIVNALKQLGFEDMLRIRDGHDRAN